MNNMQGTSRAPRTLQNASAILKDFSFPPLKLSKAEQSNWKEVLFDSIITEYDARRLYWHIVNNVCYSRHELAEDLKPWLRDEIDHAYGFSLIYSAYTDIPLDEVAIEVETRKSDFRSLKPFMQDPLKLLTLLAYDEIITAHVYHRSIKKYDTFGSPQLSTWIRKTKKDEAKHFLFFVEKIKRMFPNRLQEVPLILSELFKFDFGKNQYTGTFVLDHNTFDYPITKKEIKQKIIPTIIKKLGAHINTSKGADK